MHLQGVNGMDALIRGDTELPSAAGQNKQQIGCSRPSPSDQKSILYLTFPLEEASCCRSSGQALSALRLSNSLQVTAEFRVQCQSMRGQFG
jgi:hypothetical protein